MAFFNNLLNRSRCGNGAFVCSVAGIECTGRLEEHDLDFFGGDRPMFDAVRDDDELTLVETDDAVAQVQFETAGDDQEHFVLVFVMVPVEGALKFDQFDLLAVKFAGDARLPVMVDVGEFFRQVDFVHCLSRRWFSCLARAAIIGALPVWDLLGCFAL